MNIAVLCGGISTERNISLAGGKAVCLALKALGHFPLMIDPAKGTSCLINFETFTPETNVAPTKEELMQLKPRNLMECLSMPIFNQIDLAFIVLHGKYGEDGVIQALLEARGIPYTGSEVKASALAMDKHTSKLIFAAAGLQVAQGYPIRQENFNNTEYHQALKAELGNKLVVKPNDQGSSVGVTIIENGNIDDLGNAIRTAGLYSETVVVERFIPGREITVGLINGQTLPVVEIAPEGGWYDFKHKYTHGHTGYQCPAAIPEDVAEFAMNCARTAYFALGCDGFARADFRLNEDNVPIIIEMNTIPGFTDSSLVPMAAKSIGIEFPELCQRIINVAVEKYNKRNAK